MLARTRIAGLSGLTAMTMLLVACGGDEGGGGGAAVSARPPQEQISIASTEADVPFQLQAGRYKFGWDAPDCPSVNFTMTGQAQGFIYEKKTLQKKFSAIVSDVPEDTYTVAQTDPACTAWTVQIDRIGG
jgi:hypothetical protein